MVKSLVLALALPAFVLAEEPAKPAEGAAAAVTAEMKVGTGIESKDVVGDASEFSVAPDTRLYAFARVTGAGPEGKVTLAFFRGSQEAYRRELTVSGSPWRLHVYRTFRRGDGGDWTAKALSADGAELASVPFKVTITE